MGDSRIIINVVGDHGQDRDKKDGEQVDFTASNPKSVEAIAQECVKALKASGADVTSAKIVHWPADNNPEHRKAGAEVIDDLLTGIRSGDFSKV